MRKLAAAALASILLAPPFAYADQPGPDWALTHIR